MINCNSEIKQKSLNLSLCLADQYFSYICSSDLQGECEFSCNRTKINMIIVFMFLRVISHTGVEYYTEKTIKRTLYSEKNMNSLNVEYFLAMNIQIWTKMDNPFKRYDFSKFSLNSVKSLCRPHKLATVPCHGCTTTHW